MDIVNEVKNLSEQYYGGSITIMDGLDFSQYKTIKTIEYYTNSTYLEKDDNDGVVRPFFNIVNFRVDVAVKATDIDTKDIQVYTENPSHQMQSLLFNKEIKNWMRKVGFSKVLNEINFNRANYGGAVVKKVKRDGELYIEVPEWKNLITDAIDIKNGVIIEKHYLTPIEIQLKIKVWNKLEENQDKIDKILNKKYNKKATLSSRALVMEVEGQFKDSAVDGDSEEFTLQKHFILCDHEDNPLVVLHSERKKASDYKYIEWLKASGRALGIGIVESGFNAQIETNDAILKNKDLLELASKMWFITDSDIIENNIFDEARTGQIFKIDPSARFSQLNNIPSSLPALTDIISKWDEQYSRVSHSHESITGETMPSNTPFRSVAIQNQEAQSTFNYKKEEMEILINQMFTDKDWIFNHIKSKITREHLLSSDFDDAELKLIDENFTNYTLNKEIRKKALEGKITTQQEYDLMKSEILSLINEKLKKRRYIEIPDGYFDDIEFKIDIIVTGEQINKSAVFETLSNILVTVSSNPQKILSDPNLKKIFMKIIELSGVGITFEEPSNVPQKTEPLIPQEQNAGTIEK